jgi:hypothetical protein
MWPSQCTTSLNLNIDPGRLVLSGSHFTERQSQCLRITDEASHLRHYPSPHTSWDPSPCPWEAQFSELKVYDSSNSQMKKLRPQGSSLARAGMGTQSARTLDRGFPGTFPRGLLGVLRTRALVRGENLLASSVGSSCQSPLEFSFPSGAGLCKSWWRG